MSEGSGLPREFWQVGSSSFTDFLRSVSPVGTGGAATRDLDADAPHATTIVALAYADGVVMAGDRQATAGYQVAHRTMDKIFEADDYSVIGIAGTAGVALDMVRLFQLEIEHFEKIEKTELSLNGKAHRLAAMVRSHVPMALKGLAALPLFAGFDPNIGAGRIFSYDTVGGQYEELDHHAVGSGALHAQSTLRHIWRGDLDATQAVAAALHAIWDAADQDTATAGPDFERGIFPRVAQVDAEGFHWVPAQEVRDTLDVLAQQRAQEFLDQQAGRPARVSIQDHPTPRRRKGPGS